MTFTSKSQFAVHIRTHSAGQNYECNICGRTFIRDSYLIRHHNRVHRDNRGNASNNVSNTINAVVQQQHQQPSTQVQIQHQQQSQSQNHHSSGDQHRDVYESNSQVCDLRYETFFLIMT